MILFNLCGYNDLIEMMKIKYGIFPEIKGRNHEEIILLSFKMMSQLPADRATPETIISELQKFVPNSE